MPCATTLAGLPLLLAASTLLITTACSTDTSTSEGSEPPTATGSIYESEAFKRAASKADAAKAAAKATPEDQLLTKGEVKLAAEIDQAMAAKGESLYVRNCQSCHTLGENKSIGPGWKGVTTRREPEWIMNMILHTDAMLKQDPEAGKLLAEYQVRMPPQSLSMDEARQVLEFMRKLDQR